MSRAGKNPPASSRLFRLEKRVQIHAGKHPALLYPLYSMLGRGRDQVVRRDTELLIEGYPRSANSFAYLAFVHAQRRGRRRAGRGNAGTPRSVANNLHVPAQVVRAARWGIPSLVVIRPPTDAVTSYRVRDGIPLKLALEYYCSFHETVANYRDHYVLATFDQVTSDFGAVTERINARFGTDFFPFEHTERNVERVFSRIDAVYKRKFSGDEMESAVSRPSEDRKEVQRRVREELSRPACQPLLHRAGEAYRMVVGRDRI